MAYIDRIGEKKNILQYYMHNNNNDKLIKRQKTYLDIQKGKNLTWIFKKAKNLPGYLIIMDQL